MVVYIRNVCNLTDNEQEELDKMLKKKKNIVNNGMHSRQRSDGRLNLPTECIAEG